MIVLTSFAIVLEFLIGFRNISALLMHNKIQKTVTLQSFQKIFKISFWRIPRVLFRVLDSSQIVLQISPITFYSKIKFQKTMVLQSFQKILKIPFLRVSRVLFRVLNSTQIVLPISPNTLFSKIKIQKTMVLQIFEKNSKSLGTLKNKIFKNYLKILKYHSFLNFDFRTKCVWTYL